jgi:hypothetical protein
MRIFRTTSKLSKPSGRDRIPETTLEYLRTKTRLTLFSLVWREFKESGVSQSDLAARLGKGTDRVCKLLAAPGNWTLDTVAELLFGINGGVLSPDVTFPLDTEGDFSSNAVLSTSKANSYVIDFHKAA